jgi:hypothetical protein
MRQVCRKRLDQTRLCDPSRELSQQREVLPHGARRLPFPIPVRHECCHVTLVEVSGIVDPETEYLAQRPDARENHIARLLACFERRDITVISRACVLVQNRLQFPFPPALAVRRCFGNLTRLTDTALARQFDRLGGNTSAMLLDAV